MNSKALTLPLALLGVLAAAPAVAQDGYVTIERTLTGAGVLKGGDPDGKGIFHGEFDPESGDLCYTLEVTGVKGAKGAHIHRGESVDEGRKVITLDITGKDGDLCLAEEPKLLSEILGNRGGYYVDVHSAEFPDGAIRAQLGEKKVVAAPVAEGLPIGDAAPVEEAAPAGEAAPPEAE